MKKAPQIRPWVSHFEIYNIIPPIMLHSTSCRNCRCSNKSGGIFQLFCVLALCVACHCAKLTIYALAVSFWLHSSGQAKASGVFFFSAKCYNLAAIFISWSRLQRPLIHSSRSGPHHAQAPCYSGFPK